MSRCSRMTNARTAMPLATSHRLAPVVLLVLLGLAGPQRLVAQSSAADKAAAEALYDRGRALMRDGKLEEGCKQLERSQAIDRGAGTMLTLAECYELLGRSASAFAMFREAASFAREDGQLERAKKGEQRATALAHKLSMLTIQVAPENEFAGFTLLRNGVTVSTQWWNVPIPVDPGVYKLQASAPEYHEWTTEVQVGPNADAASVSIPPLARNPQAVHVPAPVEPQVAPSVTAASAPESRARASAAPPAATRSRWTTETIAGVAVGAAGVAALGVGGVFGLRALSKQSAADDCQGSRQCTGSQGAHYAEQANDAAKLSNVFVIGGAALAAAGAVLYFVLGEHESATPAVAVGVDTAGASVAVGGVF